MMSRLLSVNQTIQELPEEEEKEENEDNDDEVDILAELHRQTSSEDEMDAPYIIMPHRPVLQRRGSVITMGTTITCDTADTDGMTVVEEEREMDTMIFEERAQKGSVSLGELIILLETFLYFIRTNSKRFYNNCTQYLMFSGQVWCVLDVCKVNRCCFIISLVCVYGLF